MPPTFVFNRGRDGSLTKGDVSWWRCHSLPRPLQGLIMGDGVLSELPFDAYLHFSEQFTYPPCSQWRTYRVCRVGHGIPCGPAHMCKAGQPSVARDPGNHDSRSIDAEQLRLLSIQSLESHQSIPSLKSHRSPTHAGHALTAWRVDVVTPSPCPVVPDLDARPRSRWRPVSYREALTTDSSNPILPMTTITCPDTYVSNIF
jgi:hypothetical protein